MYLGLILDMTHSGLPDRGAVSVDGTTLDHRALAELSWAASARLAELGVPSVVYLGSNHPAYPVALFGAAGAGLPFIPLNYRLGAEQLLSQVEAHPGAFVIYEGAAPPFAVPGRSAEREEFIGTLDRSTAEPPEPQNPDLPCVLLYTSGTTAAPKAAVLRHRHLMSYLLGTVEFASADPDDVTLVSVPPYHVAGVANLLSNLYAGRRIIYLDRFDPETWLGVVRDEKVTQAMVVPTMLAQIVDHLQGAADAETPSLRTLSYGGARMPAPVLHRALELFPTTGFVNAYGLTETSSTIALLGPEDHRAAFETDDPAARARLGSVGKLVPGVELEVRDDEGHVLEPGRTGLLFLRGDQISGEYAGTSLTDTWFATRDRGFIDDEGYLFIEGRADDTIIRGGENIAPAEIEDVLVSHDGIVDAVVVGIPDDHWGQRLAAVVVAGRDDGGETDADELRELVRSRLRSSKTPDVIEFWPELPRTETGKLLRRTVVERLSEA